jgi:D-aminopeptidase
MTPFFVAVMDATEEAIYNSLFMATTVHGKNGAAHAINLDSVQETLRKHNLLVDPQ